MQKNQTRTLRKTSLATAMATAIGMAATPYSVNADIYQWGSTEPDLVGATTASVLDLPDYTTICGNSPDAATVIFTMLDKTNGAAIANSSITTAGANQFQTPTCGTFKYDTSDNSGTATIAPFDFFAGSEPALATGVLINKVPAGLDDGSGNMLLANMLFDWNTTAGIPVSLVWDAQGILGEMDGDPSSFTLNADGSIASATPFSNTGAIPASDGYYNIGILSNGGYINIGPVPLATQSFNTASVVGFDLIGNPVCIPGADDDYSNNGDGIDPGTIDPDGGCMGINPSADIAQAIIVDTQVNNVDYDLTTPTLSDLANDGVGGDPMVDGPFTGSNANFSYNNMKLVSFTDTTPPVITLNGTQGATINLPEGATYVEDGATCLDAPPLPQIPSAVTPGGDPIPDPLVTAGSPFTVTYDCDDTSTNGPNSATQVTRTITVIPTGSPIIALAGSSPVTHECAVAYVDAGATCTDNGGGDIPLGPVGPAPNFSLSTAGLDIGLVANGQSVTYTCDDGVTTPSTQDRTVDVTDTTAPVITITTPPPVGDIVSVMGVDTLILETTDETGFTPPAATANDSCDLTAIGASATNAPDWNITVGNQINSILNYTATDANGQAGSLQLPVEVHRSEPVVTLVGAALLAVPVGGTYTELGMNIHDEQVGDGGDLTDVITSGSNADFTWSITGASDIDTSVETTDPFPVTYTVTDNDGNVTIVVRNVVIGAFATSSNFTMLDAVGNVFGGTNDVVYVWDEVTIHTDVATDLTSNISIASAGPHDFFGAPWFAHHVRLFGPGTYSFETSNALCQSKLPSPDTTSNGSKKTTNPAADDIDVTGCAGTGSPTTMTMTVGAGQLGVHMLFDYNGTFDIDVVNVYDRNATWSDPDGDTTLLNNMWRDVRIDHPSGWAMDDRQDMDLVSRDVNGDGVNGTPMIDGPFVGFYANFNAGGTPAPPRCIAPATLAADNVTCIITTEIEDDPEDEFLGAMGWATLFGLLPALGLLRRRRNRR